MPHTLPIRVYYEDTDSGGVVYYANYLKYAERGRTEYLRSLGFENSKIHADHGMLFVVRRVEADYLASARLDDVLSLETSVLEVKNASFVMQQTIKRGNIVLFTAIITMVAINNDSKPAKLPADLKAAMLG
jgi:acyl-CoA thioester hydrolase